MIVKSSNMIRVIYSLSEWVKQNDILEVKTNKIESTKEKYIKTVIQTAVVCLRGDDWWPAKFEWWR